MNEMERAVWAAAFAAKFIVEFDFRRTHGMDSVHDFSCAEVADEAVAKFREAFTCEDAKYLMAIEEGWPT